MSLALVQCQECNAWRQLAEAPACADKWCCWMHPDPFLFTCGDSSSDDSCCLPQPCSTDSLGSMADVFYMQPLSEPSSPTTAAAPTPDDWVRCNDCNRWRRLPSDVAADTNLDQWCCAMHPDPLCRSCKQTPAAPLRTPKHFGFWESPALRTSTSTSTVSAAQQKHIQRLSGAIDFLQRQAGNLL